MSDEESIASSDKVLTFSVPRSDIKLVHGYADRNLKRAEEISGVYSVRIKQDGSITLRGETLSALKSARRILEIVVRLYQIRLLAAGTCLTNLYVLSDRSRA